MREEVDKISPPRNPAYGMREDAWEGTPNTLAARPPRSREGALQLGTTENCNSLAFTLAEKWWKGVKPLVKSRSFPPRPGAGREESHGPGIPRVALNPSYLCLCDSGQVASPHPASVPRCVLAPAPQDC